MSLTNIGDFMENDMNDILKQIESLSERKDLLIKERDKLIEERKQIELYQKRNRINFIIQLSCLFVLLSLLVANCILNN